MGNGATIFTLVVNKAGVDAVIDRFNPGLFYDTMLKSEVHDIATAHGANAKAAARQQFAQTVAQAQGGGALTASQAATLNNLANAL